VKEGGRLSVLLGSSAYGGTIAAVRALGQLGVDVGVLTSTTLSAAAWSRHANRTYAAPIEKETERYLDRLMEIGASQPGQILLPTSDETAWLYALNAERLSKYFRLCQPSIDTIRRILDKREMSDAAARAGLGIVPTWIPRTLEEVRDLAPTLTYPILIKPRTHVYRRLNDKGFVAYSPEELVDEYGKILEAEESGRNRMLGDANLPILQRFVTVSDKGVYSVTGFIDRTGELFVTRSATKVFQRSQPAGVGVCFESRPTNPALSEGVRRLCRELGYFGMFEVEFLWCDDTWAAIDFNPRLFSQVGLDIRRKMPLPLLYCLEAAGETEALRLAVEKARAADRDIPAVFYDRFTLRAILLAKTLTMRLSSKERAYWRAWVDRDPGQIVDFAADPGDPMPGVIHAMSEISLGVRAIPRFLRSNGPANARQASRVGTPRAEMAKGQL
jgi:predicted ATP-grasp superfamily ATP-dependent carboligase